MKRLTNSQKLAFALSELKLHRKLLFQANQKIDCLAYFIIEAGRGETSAEIAHEVYLRCRSQAAAAMSEFDVDHLDVLEDGR